jgi:Tfp pilus assembly protein PilF
LKVETTETSAVIDLAPFYVKENGVLIDVKDKNDPKAHSKPYTINKLSKAEQARIKQLLSEVTDATAEQTALNHYLMAGFYEENKLLVDAISSYEEAIKLAPDVEMFKESYQEFLIRNGIKK